MIIIFIPRGFNFLTLKGIALRVPLIFLKKNLLNDKVVFNIEKVALEYKLEVTKQSNSFHNKEDRIRIIENKIDNLDKNIKEIDNLSNSNWKVFTLLFYYLYWNGIAFLTIVVNLTIPGIIVLRATTGIFVDIIWGNEGFNLFLSPDESIQPGTAFIDLILVFYIIVATVTGYFNFPYLKSMHPKYKATATYKILINIIILEIIALSFPIFARIIGLIRYNLLGMYANVSYWKIGVISYFYKLLFLMALTERYIDLFPFSKVICKKILKCKYIRLV